MKVVLIISLISVIYKNAFSFDSTLTNKLQFTLDSVRVSMNLKGISAAIYIPGQETWFGVSGISHQGVSITKNMLFGIASNTKTFFSVLALKLEEMNLLKLDDSLYHWISNYQFIDSTITIRMLLNHTSGIFDITSKPGYADTILANPDRHWTVMQLLDRFLSAPYFPKATGFQYSNTNYLLLGLIIKTVMNEEASIILRQLIINPYSLNRTYFAFEESLPDTVANPWANGVDISGVPRTSLLSAAWTAGAMYSNSENMAQWYSFLFAGNVLSPSSMNKMLNFTPQSSYSYGLGVIKYNINGRILWGHSGSIRGYTSSFLYDTTMKMSIIVLTNQYPGNAYLVSTALLNTVINNVTSFNEELQLPIRYFLYQNYPNPFNPSTKIRWRSPKSSWQTLKVYDVLGNEVATLVDEFKPAGSYEVEFSAETSIKHPASGMGYASGVYFYQLRTENFIQTKKMILEK